MDTNILSFFSGCVVGSTLSSFVRVVLQQHRGRGAGNAVRSAQRPGDRTHKLFLTFTLADAEEHQATTLLLSISL